MGRDKGGSFVSIKGVLGQNIPGSDEAIIFNLKNWMEKMRDEDVGL